MLTRENLKHYTPISTAFLKNKVNIINTIVSWFLGGDSVCGQWVLVTLEEGVHYFSILLFKPKSQASLASDLADCGHSIIETCL